MIDQDKMRALAQFADRLRVEDTLCKSGCFTDEADAIYLLLAEVEAIKQAILDPENQPSQYGTVLLEAAAADKRDAERYRYLRSRPESVEPDRIDVVYWSALDESANEGEGLRGDALDAAIDAALAQRQGEGS